MKKHFLLLLFIMLGLNLQAQLVSEKRGSDDFKIGIAGFSYRAFNLDETLSYLKSLNVKYLSVKAYWLPMNSTKEQMDEFKDKCAKYGVEGYILGPIYMKSKAEVDRTFDYAKRFGSKVFIGIPNYELLDYTIQKVAETGIKVAIHTHGPSNLPFPNIKTIVDKVKDPSLGIGCCMDLGHSVRMGDDVINDIKKYKEWIYDIHIKDETEASKNGKTCEMGRGVMDFEKIIKALRKIKYNGVISLEYEKDKDNPHPGIAESIGYLRAVCDLTK